MEEPFTEWVYRHCRQPQEWQNVAWLKFYEIGEAVGIVATLFVVFYFSRKQMQKISMDIETKVPSELDEKINDLTQMTIEKPQLMRAVSNVVIPYRRDGICLPSFVYVCACISDV